jgi:hypothetical protein
VLTKSIKVEHVYINVNSSNFFKKYAGYKRDVALVPLYEDF